MLAWADTDNSVPQTRLASSFIHAFRISGYDICRCSSRTSRGPIAATPTPILPAHGYRGLLSRWT